MKITIEEIAPDMEEELILRCHEVTGDILQTAHRLSADRNEIIVCKGRDIRRLPLSDIHYFEVVDNRSFVYCKDEVYECKLKLYEFEAMIRGTLFFRASKSMILNAAKIDHITPSFSGRFEVTLTGNERIIVSRKYVSVLKKLMGL